jgi:hypothetical protein
MQNLNKIEPKHIAQLEPVQLVALLRILLFAEARDRGIAKTGIHVPAAITVADGGEDGRWQAAIEPNGFIPNSFTVYQCKAKGISKAECEEEILEPIKKGQSQRHLKTQVDEVLTAEGCYCLFCREDLNQKQINERIEGFKKGLSKSGHDDFANQIRILDGNKITTWTNLHIAAIAHVTRCCGLNQPLAFLDWNSWRRSPEIAESPYIPNSFLEEQLAAIRKCFLCQNQNEIVRITGPSGLGKTRLSHEVFRPVGADGKKDWTLTDSMAFIECDEHNAAHIKAIVHQLALDGTKGIVVVDNCPKNLHDELCKFVRIADSHLSLLTTDYGEDSLTTGFTSVSITPALISDIVPKLLRQTPVIKAMRDDQIRDIVQFCQGYPQIAKLIAELKGPLTYDQLQECNLAQKLVWGRTPPSVPATKVLKALSLFSHVGISGNVAGQLTFISQKICNLDERDVRDIGLIFKKRILQTAGNYWRIVPEPIAVALAGEWWESATANELMSLLPEINKTGLIDAFCERLQMLNFSKNCPKITDYLCGPNGPFASAEVLFSGSGSRLFRALVDLNPRATLHALNAAVQNKSIDELQSITESRRNLVWALEKLAWSADRFTTAATLLLRMAAAENESWSNNATGIFKRLYQLYLSGTQLPAFDRLTVLRAGLSHADFRIKRVCVEALVEALKSVDHFHRGSGPEKRGSSLPEQDWQPQNPSEIRKYNLTAFEMLKTLILSPDEIAIFAKDRLGSALYSILLPEYLLDVKQSLIEIAHINNGFWPSARNILQQVYVDLNESQAEQADVVLEILQAFQPSDIARKLDQVVTHAGYCDRKLPSGQYVDDAELEAKNLGIELGHDLNGAWVAALPTLLSGKQEKGFMFGQGLAESCPDIKKLIDLCLMGLRDVNQQQNPALLCGILAHKNSDNYLDYLLKNVAADKKLSNLFPRIMTARKCRAIDVALLSDLILKEDVGRSELSWLCRGKVTTDLTVDELCIPLMKVGLSEPAAAVEVYDVIEMYCLQNDERFTACSSAIRKLFMLDGFLENIAGASCEDSWHRHALCLLDQNGGNEFAVNQTQQLVNALLNSNDLHSRRHYSFIGEVFKRFGNECWPIVGAALKTDKYYRVDNLISAHSVYYDTRIQKGGEVFYCSLWNLPIEVLVQWLKENPEAEVLERLIRRIALFKSDDKGAFTWHPIALALLEMASEETMNQCLRTNLICFGSTGSRVPYLQRRIDLLESTKSLNETLMRVSHEISRDLSQEIEIEQKNDEEFRAGIF